MTVVSSELPDQVNSTFLMHGQLPIPDGRVADAITQEQRIFREWCEEEGFEGHHSWIEAGTACGTFTGGLSPSGDMDSVGDDMVH